MKSCTKCGETKDYGAFYFSQGKYSSWCRDCSNGRFASAEGKRIIKDRNLRKLYGITLEQFEEMVEKQGKLCALCQRRLPRNPKHVHVDHHHRFGFVRGILCQQCNVMIGCANDDPARLLKGVDYLRNSMRYADEVLMPWG